MKTSEVLQLALDDGRYLSQNAGGQSYLCYLLHDMMEESLITREARGRASDAIYGSFDTRAVFLKEHLYKLGLIHLNESSYSQKYKELTNAHWQQLIADLKAKND